MANELSTVGVTLGYAVETTAGTVPTSFTEIENITSIGEISSNPDRIEVTNLKDTWKRYIDGVKSGAESVPIKANFTSAFRTAWNAARTAAVTGASSSKACWWCVTVGTFGKFTFAGMPSELGLPSIEVNNAFAGEVSVTVNQVGGWSDIS